MGIIRDLLFDIFNILPPPQYVWLDACTKCQLNCPCDMRVYNNCGVGSGYLTAENFLKFVKLNPQLKGVELSNNGEIFLNPELRKIIEIAFEHNIKLYCANGTNFNYVSDDVLRALAFFPNFTYLNFSIDGASQEVYSKYRRNGNFDKVIENIKKLNEYREFYGNDTLICSWQYIILESSADIKEIKKAKKMAEELGLEIWFKKDAGGWVPPNKKEIEEETGVVYEDHSAIGSIKGDHYCLSLWQQPAINYDGKLFGCCNNYWRAIPAPNAFEVPLKKIMKSKSLKLMKKVVMGKYRNPEQKEKNAIWCYNCWFYNKHMCRYNDFLTKKTIIEYTKWIKTEK